jgi:hypothetical protein
MANTCLLRLTILKCQSRVGDTIRGEPAHYQKGVAATNKLADCAVLVEFCFVPPHFERILLQILRSRPG